MTHAKNTTIVDAKDDGRFLYITSVVGPDGKAVPHHHKMPLLTVALRAAEYDLDPEDPLALDLVLREHLYIETGHSSYEVNDTHPLFYLDSVTEAREFMEARLEEVRVDRRAPAAETGARMLAGAVQVKVASRGLVRARDRLLQAVDPRVVEPVQFYRDQFRERLARDRANADPVGAVLRQYKRDRARALEPPRLSPPRVMT